MTGRQLIEINRLPAILTQILKKFKPINKLSNYMKNMRLFLLLCSLAAILKSASEEPLTMVFAHGLADTAKQAFLWQEAHPRMHEGALIAQNFPDATEQFWRVNFPWTSLGQDNEIAALKETIDAYQQKHSDKDKILSGISRGATTVINYAALHQPHDVKALLLISPFPSMRHVAQNLIKKTYLQNIPYAQEFLPYLVGCIFWQYSDSGIHAIDVVTQIDQNIPILFISLEHDHLVPSHLTQLLVDKLKDNGHTRVHHLRLHEGKHGKPIPGKEGEKMQNIIQAFYYHYNLSCNLESAKLGIQEFLHT